MKRLFVISLTASLLALSLNVSAQAVDLSELPQETYRHDPDLKLYFMYPAGAREGDKIPTVIFFFGGGWNHGNPTAFAPQAEYLARRGMLAVLADYRIKSKHGVTPDKCVEDAKSAMRYLKTNADRLMIDTTRLAASGGSAGGHLAAATAFVDDFNSPADDTTISTRPTALILFNPVVNNMPSPNVYVNKDMKDFFPQISPYHNIKVGAPPTLIMSGDQDKIVDVATLEAYKEKMEQQGAICELEIYEGAEHGFFNANKGPKFFKQTLERMDTFLVSLGYLPEKSNGGRK